MCSGQEYEWLVVVAGGCVWVRMGAYGRISLGKHENRHGRTHMYQMHMIARPLWPGNFPFPKYMCG